MTGQPARGWSKASRRRAPGKRCDNCRRGKAVHDRTDASGMSGRVCDSCHQEGDEALAFS